MRTATALLLITSLACTHAQGWVATGESLSVLGQSFAATGKLMDSALDAKAVTVEQYRRWAAFSHFFKPTYDVACDRWLHADDDASEHAAAVLAALAAELAGWTAIVTGGK